MTKSTRGCKKSVSWSVVTRQYSIADVAVLLRAMTVKEFGYLGRKSSLG